MRRLLCLVAFTWVFGLATAQAQRVEWIRAAYWDARYPTGWIDDSISVFLRDGLQAAGYEILNADQLKTWMEARIADGKYSVVVLCRDNPPDTVCEPLLNSVLRRYLDAGGKVVALCDIPFYNEGHPNLTRNNWGNNGAPRILGFNTSPTTGGVARNRNQAVTFTPAGTRWGLTQTWLSNRPADPTNPADLIVLATDNAGSAAAWMKPYVAGDTFRGFVRIWDFDIAITTIPPLADLIRVAEYSGGPRASNPDPADGAMGVNMLLLQWASSDLTASQDVYFGTDKAAVAAATASSPEYRGTKSAMEVAHFEPVPIQPGMTYYWRVDQVDADGVLYQGDVWSFTATPSTAWMPKPADGTAYVAPDTVLEWTAGLNVVNHDVYFGTDRAAVEAGAAETKKVDTQITTSYTPDGLEPGTTYYWRVDEVVGATATPGAVWSFTVQPPAVAKVDPNLIGWWKMDAENPSTAADYSGWENHGTLTGNAQWTEGYAGSALSLDGIDDSVDCGAAACFNFSGSVTIAAWVKTMTTLGDVKIASNQNNSTGGYKFGLYGNKPEIEIRNAANSPTLNRPVEGGTVLSPGTWYHVAAVYTMGQSLRTYVNGKLDRERETTEIAGASDGVLRIGRESYSASYFFLGQLDDVRLYNRALSEDEIAEIAQGDPLVASDRQPARDATLGLLDATELSWSSGATAAEHDVYFGTGAAPEFVGRQDETSFDLAGLVAFGGGDYFWRIDEVEADGTTIHAGDVWKFTVPGALFVDDFELYNDEEGQGTIYETWIDGLTNGTGSMVGYWNPPFAERAYVHNGWQALPLDYNNINMPFYSEAYREFAPVRDWTTEGADALSLWFKGQAVTFLAKPDGSYLLSSASGDITGTNNDNLRFAYKQLTGDGWIIAKVNSLTETWNWAKGGVMIRETLDVASARAHMIATGERRLAFENRSATNGASASVYSAVGAFPLPVWVKLERKGDQVTGYYSTDGTNWVAQTADNGGGGTSPNPQTITMGDSACIGLCVTSNNTGTPALAEFSDVVTSDTVTGDWTVVEIGTVTPAANDPQDLYVALEDDSGKVAVVTWPDATILTDWTPWTIPLSQFTGVDLSAVAKVIIGVGNRDNPQQDGAGKVYLDDVQVLKSAQ
jgi:hypothetical protein